MRARQTLLILLTALGATASYVWLQGKFDRSDHEKSERLVRSFTGKEGRSIEETLARRDPAARLDSAWSSEILSSCRGTMRVRCRLEKGEYAFDVDLVRRTFHPANQAAQSLMSELGVGPSKPAP